MEARLIGQYNAKWLFSLVYLSKPLMTKITAIYPSFRTDCFPFFSFFIEGDWMFLSVSLRIRRQRREKQQQMLLCEITAMLLI